MKSTFGRVAGSAANRDEPPRNTTSEATRTAREVFFILESIEL
jgi:hypothetical protein